jgi:aminoglycoside 3-N-acetyltransferase
MPTYPMSGLSQEYLERHLTFDWRRTASRSGLLTEVFRRMPGTERSLHPTHPLAARGVRARWLTEGHERSVTPFDEHSPYPRLLELNAWILNLGHFEAMTLRHFADHLIQESIPYPIYSDRRVTVRARAKDGREHVIVTRAHNPALSCDHRLVLERMRRDRILLTARVARVPVSMVRIQRCMEAYRRYHEEGAFRHFLKPLPPPAASGC